jgi:hypothetical protein
MTSPSDHARDLHASSILIDGLDVSLMNRLHFTHMHQGGVTAANVTITTQHGFQETVERIRSLDRTLDEEAE